MLSQAIFLILKTLLPNKSNKERIYSTNECTSAAVCVFLRIAKEISKIRICARSVATVAARGADLKRVLLLPWKGCERKRERQRERERVREAAPGETGIHCARTSVRIWLSIVGAFPRILALSSCLYLGRTVIKHR